jgi:flagellar hook assembly protein FlgD
MTFDPDRALLSGTVYAVELAETATSALGIPMAGAFAYQFQTVGATAAVTVAAAPTAAGAQVTVNLSAGALVKTTVVNLAGRVVAELPERELPEGMSSLLWNGRSAQGTRVPAGRYLVRVEARGSDGASVSAMAPLNLR